MKGKSMAKMMDMFKQASQMRKEMKRIQDALEKHTVEYSNGGVTVVARGDMAIQSLTIAPETFQTAKTEKLERILLQNVNAALKLAKRDAQKMMSQATSGGGLAEMFGGG